jgi:micrococcal nuclease
MTRISMRKLKNPYYLLAVIIVLFISYFYGGELNSLVTQQVASPTPTLKLEYVSTSSATLVKVLRAIDGDTIELDGGQKVRYIGIDTPELHDPRKKVECFAKEAMEKNKELVEAKEVRLEKDISERDKYNRLLRYVYLPTEASPSGEFVNALLVQEGYALASTFPPDVKYAELFKNLEKEARENKRGLWNKCIP